MSGSLLLLLLVCAALGPSRVEAAAPHPRGARSVRTVPENSKYFDGETDEYFTLPDDFLFGAGSAAMQVEGAWDEDGRTPSVLECWSPNLDQTNLSCVNMQDKTADSYHLYKEDIAKAAELKLKVYRFSVSWSRVLPNGDRSKINKPGVDYYNDLIDTLIANGIKPMITMNHFDYPLSVLKKTGGWANEAIVPAFKEYADFLFETFGDRVKLWTTVNEANYYCMTFALYPVPGLYEPAPGDDYKCSHHTILAHMEAYRLYEKKYKADQNGKIGAAALTLWCRPNSTSYEDTQAAARVNTFSLGSIYHPLVHGDYPQALRERVDHYSALEGLSVSRLPSFTEDQKRRLKGSADFLCFNAYMGTIVADATNAPHPEHGTMASDRDAVEVNSDNRPGHFGNSFMRADPWLLRDAALFVRDNYPKVPLLITENGWGDQRTDVDPRDDEPRVGYHSQYLYELVRAAKQDNANIMGYLIWSLLDSFEWSAAYGRKFGLVHVDYENGTLKRTLKNSAWFFQEIGSTRKVKKVPFTFDPESGSDTPDSGTSGNDTHDSGTSGSNTILMHPALHVVLLIAVSSWLY